MLIRLARQAARLTRSEAAAPAAATAAPATLAAVAAAALWVAVLLNLPPLWERASSVWQTQPRAWPLLGPLAELCLVLGTTGLLLGLAWLGGRWSLRVLGSALIVISALCAYYMARFKVVIGYGVVNAVLTTDHDLSGEIVGFWLLLWALLLGVLPAVWFWRRVQLGGLAQGWRRRQWWRAIGWLLLSSALLAAVGNNLLNKARKTLHSEEGPETNLVGVAAHTYLPSNWIASTGMVLGSRWREARDEARLINPAKTHRFVPETKLDDTVVVMVIGETTRSDRMGLLGHSRDTTPHLSANPHVAAFAGWSCNTATKLSLACMFVRPQAVAEGRNGKPDRILEDNVFAIYKQLGFAIDLYAMQSEAGFYSRVRADQIKLREVLAAQPENAGKRLDDLLLLPELEQSLRQHPAGQGPLLVVLHTKGSHAMYSQRHPPEFTRWAPECLNADQFCNVDELFNAFDNSVLFVDHVLNELQRSLAGRKALMVYSSDHGESIDENRHFHATPRHIAPPEQRRVPLVFWASDRWRADPTLGARFERLQQRAKEARQLPQDDPSHGHHNLFASLLGCSGISSPDGGIPPNLDLCR